jgi:hypothetical protein
MPMASASITRAAGTVPQIPPFNHQPVPYTGPGYDETMALRKKYLSPCERGILIDVILEMDKNTCSCAFPPSASSSTAKVNYLRRNHKVLTR